MKLFVEIFRQRFCFRRRKMKCRGSSETRFPKVWGRTEPSSGGKRPFENSTFSAPQNFERPKNREDSSDFDDFWTKWIAPTRSIILKKFPRRARRRHRRFVVASSSSPSSRGRWHGRAVKFWETIGKTRNENETNDENTSKDSVKMFQNKSQNI